MNYRIRTTVLPLLSAMIWGAAFVAQKGNTTGPLTFNASRSIVAVLFLLIVIAISTKGDVKHLLSEQSRKDTLTLWTGGILCGLALTAATFFQQYGLDGSCEAGKASFLTAMYIVLVPVCSIFVKKSPSLRTWISVFIAVIGLFMLCIKNDFTFELSDLMIIICSGIFTTHIMLIDHFSPKCNGIKLSCIQFMVCFAISGTLGLIIEQPTVAEIAPSIKSILYLGIMSSGVAYTLQIIAQKDANPALLSILLSCESLFGALSGAIFLGEVLTIREYIGCLVMAIAIVIGQLPERKKDEG